MYISHSSAYEYTAYMSVTSGNASTNGHTGLLWLLGCDWTEVRIGSCQERKYLPRPRCALGDRCAKEGDPA